MSRGTAKYIFDYEEQIWNKLNVPKSGHELLQPSVWVFSHSWYIRVYWLIRLPSHNFGICRLRIGDK
jgi:hypothetical protein